MVTEDEVVGSRVLSTHLGMPLLITGMEKCTCCSDKGGCASFDGLVERDSGFLTHVFETSAISTALRAH